ncbi:MAG: hypothetical protein E7399_00235 [Ruminococcaceae bacterium]|nr:hypothetical protein [Oscillospiraceae bacterium]
MLLLMRVLFRFFSMDEDHPLGKWLIILTEPILYPVRIFLEKRFSLPGFFDWSYLVVMIAADFCETILIMLIRIVL